MQNKPRGALSALENEDWMAEPELEPATAARTRWRRSLMIGAVALILIAGAVFGARWMLVGRYLETTDDAYLQADTITVSPKIAGYVAEVAVDDNQQVTAGQVLVRIDDRDYRAELAQSEAQLASAKAELRNVEAQIVQQKTRLAANVAQIASAGAQFDYAGSESERYRNLVESGAVSRQRSQLAQTDLKRSNAALGEARAMLETARAQLAVLETQHDKAAAAIQSAEAIGEQSRLRLSFTTITAASDGAVGDRSVRVGQFVQPGSRLITIVPVHDIYLVANFKETQLGQMYRGERVRFTLDAFPGLQLEGTIDSLAPGTGAQFALLPAENATGNFTKIVQRVPVKIKIDPNSQYGVDLRPGLSATATVDTRTAPEGARTTLAPAPVHAAK
ncbi:MAG: emrK [Rhodospirillales bacterium]|nr:emrK [Rhodospirillales bacterium]